MFCRFTWMSTAMIRTPTPIRAITLYLGFMYKPFSWSWQGKKVLDRRCSAAACIAADRTGGRRRGAIEAQRDNHASGPSAAAPACPPLQARRPLPVTTHTHGRGSLVAEHRADAVRKGVRHRLGP
jgi:hypothetical protein